MPVISVIVTCFNVAEYIEQCLESVVSQTLRDLEIIVVDDGSTDGTSDIIRRYASVDSRIKGIFLPENTIGGVASAANAGLDVASGDFVGFVDGDDFVDRRMFEKLVDAALEHRTDLAMCKYLEYLEPTGKTREPAEQGKWVDVRNAGVIELGDTDSVVRVLGFIAVPWRKIYRRKFLEDNSIRFPVVDRFWEDNPFHWFSVISAESVAIVHEPLYFHRVGREGQTMSLEGSQYVKIFRHHETIRDWLTSRGAFERFHPALFNWAIVQYEWVLNRLGRDDGPQLYRAFRPIAQLADEKILDVALRMRAGNTGRMIRSIHKGNEAEFLELYQARFEAETAAAKGLWSRLERGLSMVRLARENTKIYGLRNTLAKTVSRFRPNEGRGRRRKISQGGTPVTEAQMLKLLAILEADAGRRHDEIKLELEELREELRRLRSDAE